MALPNKSRQVHMDTTASLFKSITILVSCCLLFACASTISVKDKGSIPKDEVLVFGEVDITNVKDNFVYILYIAEEGSQKEIDVQMSRKELFCWHLRPGKYIITGFSYSNTTALTELVLGVNSNTSGRIWVTFEVPRDCNAVYIGTLRMAIGGLSQVFIRDDMDSAISALKEKFTTSSLNIKKVLMKKEEL